MIKEVLQQLEPLDAQIDALCSRADDAEMASTVVLMIISPCHSLWKNWYSV